MSIECLQNITKTLYKGLVVVIKLKDFVLDIYKEGGITAAANKLHVSQPALSSSLKRLESELGVVLFDRATSAMQPTMEGKLYIETLIEVNRLKRNLQMNFDDIKDLKSGSVWVGAAHFVMSFFLLNVISEFSKKYPGISVNAVESDSTTLKEKLANGDLDIVLDYDFDETYFTSYPVLTEQIFLCVPKCYDVNGNFLKYSISRDDIISDNASKKSVCADLTEVVKNCDFILMREGNNMHTYSQKILNDFDVLPNVVFKTDQLATAYEAAISELGVTFVTDSMVKSIDDKGKLCYYKLPKKHSYRTLYFAKNKNMYSSKASEAFIEFATEKKRIGEEK